MQEYKVAENISKKELLYLLEFIVNNFLFAENKIFIKRKANKYSLTMNLTHEQFHKLCHDYEKYRNSFL